MEDCYGRVERVSQRAVARIVGQAGVVLNPKKFQFASRDIADERIDPLPKFYSVIDNFPTPTSTTDIRSWFGLVNQVAIYAQLREYMEPFRPFLSPRHSFEWTPALNIVFESSKAAIVEEIKEGLEIFDLDKLNVYSHRLVKDKNRPL